MRRGKQMQDLFQDLRDGQNLIILLEMLSGQNLPRERGRMRVHQLQNIQIALNYIKFRKVKLVNIRPEDIVDGNQKLTLGLIWTIILHFQVSSQPYSSGLHPSPTPSLPSLYSNYFYLELCVCVCICRIQSRRSLDQFISHRIFMLAQFAPSHLWETIAPSSSVALSQMTAWSCGCCRCLEPVSPRSSDPHAFERVWLNMKTFRAADVTPTQIYDTTNPAWMIVTSCPSLLAHPQWKTTMTTFVSYFLVDLNTNETHSRSFAATYSPPMPSARF